jgi:sec-independent protein translocase protein TatC
MTPLDLVESSTEEELADPTIEYLDSLPDDVEMSLFDHLEELRQRIFYSLIALVVGAVGCFLFVKPLVQLLEAPARGIKFLQLAPGEFFFVSLKVAGYSGLLVAIPVILYQIIQFILPGLTRRERRLILPVVAGSTVLFLAGLVFAYLLLIPAAVNFFMNYGEDVVEQLWSIDRYFEFVLLLLLSTGLAFQIPVIQILLGLLGIVSAKQMLSAWRYVLLGSAVLGAVLTPSTDPITQTLLASAVVGLYFGGIAMVALLGNSQGWGKFMGAIASPFTKVNKTPAIDAIAPQPSTLEETPTIEEENTQNGVSDLADLSQIEAENPTIQVEDTDIENQIQVEEEQTIQIEETAPTTENNPEASPPPPPVESNQELVEEQAVPEMLPQRFVSKVINALFTLLDLWCEERGEVAIKRAINIKRIGGDWTQVPDLCYVSYERLPAGWMEDQACPTAPELVIDMISPKQTFGELVDKATEYLEAGVLRVWLVDCQARSITVFYADARPRTYRGEMEITDPLFDGLELIPELLFRQARLPNAS